MLIKVQGACRTPNGLGHERKFLCLIITKTLNVQNEERILKAAREKD